MIPLYVPQDWHADIKQLAADQEESVAEWVRGLIRAAAPKEMTKRWSEPAKRGNPTFVKKKPRGRPRKPQ